MVVMIMVMVMEMVMLVEIAIPILINKRPKGKSDSFCDLCSGQSRTVSLATNITLHYLSLPLLLPAAMLSPLMRKYILQFEQIQFCYFDKYILPYGQIHFVKPINMCNEATDIKIAVE